MSKENTALLEKKTLEPLLAGVCKNLEEFKKISVASFSYILFCPPFKLVVKAKFLHGKNQSSLPPIGFQKMALLPVLTWADRHVYHDLRQKA